LKRAEAVKQFFNDIGYSEIDIKTTGLGEINPIAANSTEEGRKKNRRIEIVFAH
jgi:outer membrane protein OmpA-like peptidoglycan-associated protein